MISLAYSEPKAMEVLIGCLRGARHHWGPRGHPIAYSGSRDGIVQSRPVSIERGYAVNRRRLVTRICLPPVRTWTARLGMFPCPFVLARDSLRAAILKKPKIAERSDVLIDYKCVISTFR